MKPPLKAASSSSCAFSGITPAREIFSPSGLSAFGSCVPGTKCSVTRRRSTATTNTSAQPRFTSGWSSVFIMYGASPGLRGSVMGTHTPSPGADHDFSAGPGSFGANGGRGGGAPGVADGIATATGACGAGLGTAQCAFGAS